MNWVPVVLIVFKVLVLGIGMFFSIKWHYDQDKSSEPLNVKKFILESIVYIVLLVIVFSLLYELFHYLRMLPVGLDYS